MTRKSKRELETAIERVGGGETFTLPDHWPDSSEPVVVDEQAFLAEWKRRAAGPSDPDSEES